MPLFLELSLFLQGVVEREGSQWFVSDGFSSYSPHNSWDLSLAKHIGYISEIIYCGFLLRALVSAPKKGLNKTGSFSWI